MKRFKLRKMRTGLLLTLVLAAAPAGLIVTASPAHAAPVTDTWTGAVNSLWSNAGNWSAGVPTNGMDLVFNSTSLASSQTLTNNLADLQVNSISFTGSNTSDSYSLSGNTIELSGGITVSPTTSGYILFGVTLTGDQTFSGPSATAGLFFQNSTSTIDLNGYTLTDAMYSSQFYGLKGSGKFINDPGAGTPGTVIYHPPSSGSLLADIEAKTGVLSVNIDDPASIGTGKITVDDGAYIAFTSNTVSSQTLNNDFVLNGMGYDGVFGYSGAIDSTLHDAGSGTSLTLAGNVTLAGNTQIGGPLFPPVGRQYMLILSGTSVKNGFALTAVPGSGVVIVDNSTAPTQPPTGGSSSNTNGSSSPKAPDTGYGVSRPHSLGTVIVFGLAASLAVGLSFVTRRLSKRYN